MTVDNLFEGIGYVQCPLGGPCVVGSIPEICRDCDVLDGLEDAAEAEGGNVPLTNQARRFRREVVAFRNGEHPSQRSAT